MLNILDNINIELTRKQFETLLKLVYLGNWLVNGLRPPKEQLQKFNDLEQLIFSIAKKFGFDKYVSDFDQEFREFFPTQRLEGATIY